MGKCFDEIALFGRGTRFMRPDLLESRDGARTTFLVSREVVVGSKHQSDAPIGHRQIRIDFRRLLKRSLGLVMVEPVSKRESLIEVTLRKWRFGRHRVMN